MRSYDRLKIRSVTYLKINIFFIEDRKQNLKNIYKEAKKQRIYQILYVIDRILDSLCQEIKWEFKIVRELQKVECDNSKKSIFDLVVQKDFQRYIAYAIIHSAESEKRVQSYSYKRRRRVKDSI